MNPEQQAVEKAFKPLIDAKSRRKLSVRITDLKKFDETKEGLSFKTFNGIEAFRLLRDGLS